MTPVRRLQLDWQGDSAQGPDGTDYSIQTERPLHEPVWHSPLVRRPGDRQAMGRPFGFPDEREVFPDGFRGTKAQTRRWCEVDAYRRAFKAAEFASVLVELQETLDRLRYPNRQPRNFAEAREALQQSAIVAGEAADRIPGVLNDGRRRPSA